MDTLNDTPRSERLHIGIFGKRNSGKSTLMNALTGQETAVVSDTPGTTTDPVYKSIEIPSIGACVLIDTAGFDDVGALGELRVESTRFAAEKTEVAVILFSAQNETDEEKWVKYFKGKNIPLVPVLNLTDEVRAHEAELTKRAESLTGESVLILDAKTGEGVSELFTRILRVLPEDYGAKSITGNLAKSGETVLLVMPQDIAAPKGRLILPQVQTIRELLDKKCVVISATADKFSDALAACKEPPALIITDSQVFKDVYEKKPKKSKLTSFSVLFANYKGDMEYFTASLKKLNTLPKTANVLIAEACTHKPLNEDIGRVKLPRLLKKKYGEELNISFVNGKDFPRDLSPYDFIIHCGACMFNRRYVLERAGAARAQNIPMSNYGLVLAELSGIADKITLPSD